MDLEALDGVGVLQGKNHLAVPQGGLAVVVDDDDVLQTGEPVQDLAHLWGMLALGEDGLRLCVFEPNI
jgi:hypothetical protein